METDDLSGFDSYRIEWEAPCRIRSEDKNHTCVKDILLWWEDALFIYKLSGDMDFIYTKPNP